MLRGGCDGTATMYGCRSQLTMRRRIVGGGEKRGRNKSA
jgi:hypothetical protein